MGMFLGRAAALVIALVLVLAGVAAPSGMVAQAAPAAPAATAAAATARDGADVTRLSGANRYEIAVKVSRARFADPAAARTVYLMSRTSSLEGVAGGMVTDGPLLPVSPSCNGVSNVVAAEIARLDPDRVVALGSTALVCDATLKAAAAGRPSARLAGADTPGSVAAIARHAFPSGAATVYLTRSGVSPHAVTAGALRDGPVLAVSADGASLPEATRQAIADLDPTTVVALGGTGSVSRALLDQAATGRTQLRLGGSNRYSTAAAIAKRAYPNRTSQVYLVRGDGTDLTDAISAGILQDGPVLLTPGGTCTALPTPTKSFLRERHPSRIKAFGSTGTLCGSTLVGASNAARGAVDCAAVPCVALTFDDGPGAPSPSIITALSRAQVPATFFVVGEMVDGNPAVARREHIEGHQVANHSWNHPELPTLSLTGQRNQVAAVETELRSHGIPRTTVLRPPYGAYDANTRNLGYPLIIWDVDPQDWTSITSSTVYSRVVNKVQEGSIVLMHDIHWRTATAVPDIVATLKARGYTLVTVEELVPAMEDGDLVYRRDTVRPPSVATTPQTDIVTPDGQRLGELVDESGVPGLAPAIMVEDLLPTG